MQLGSTCMLNLDLHSVSSRDMGAFRQDACAQHPVTSEGANLDVQQVLAVFQLVQLQLKLENALLADGQVVFMAAWADRLHVMHQVILVHQLC